jgi:hypothetical protein
MTEIKRRGDYLALFDQDGYEVQACWNDLLRLEARTLDLKIYQRVLTTYDIDRHAVFTLISDRVGLVPAVIQIHIWPSYSALHYKLEHSGRSARDIRSRLWEISLVTNGIADDPNWDLEQALTVLRGCPGRNYLAPSVEKLIRAHVRPRLAISRTRPTPRQLPRLPPDTQPWLKGQPALPPRQGARVPTDYPIVRR